MKNLIYPILAAIYRKITGNRGVIKDKFSFKDWDFLGGNIARVVNNASGDWIPFRPDGELQKRQGAETMACVSFSAMNVLETFINYLMSLGDKATDEQKEILKIFEYFGFIKNGQANFSDRYIAKLSNTSWRGNSFRKVADTIRKYGLLPEGDHPYVVGWGKYYSTINKDKIKQGKKIFQFLEISYEFITKKEFVVGKKHFPIQTSICSRSLIKNGIYRNIFRNNDHAISTDATKEKEYHNVFDTYKPFSKKHEWDYLFGVGVCFDIKLKKKLNIFNKEEIAKLKKRGLKYVMLPEQSGEVYELGDGILIKRTRGDITNDGVLELEKAKKLVGISNDFYYNNLHI